MRERELELERVLKALANKRRLAIIRVIKNEKNPTVAHIASKIKLSFRATSKHLLILAAANIVEKNQHGLLVYNRLADNLPPVVRSTIVAL